MSYGYLRNDASENHFYAYNIEFEWPLNVNLKRILKKWVIQLHQDLTLNDFNIFLIKFQASEID